MRGSWPRSTSGVPGAQLGIPGLYLVHPEFRGRGIGLELFHAALARHAPGSVGLDGDAASRRTTDARVS